MNDYEHAGLEHKIRELERRIEDLEYDMRQLKDIVVDKAEKGHTHRSND